MKRWQQIIGACVLVTWPLSSSADIIDEQPDEKPLIVPAPPPPKTDAQPAAVKEKPTQTPASAKPKGSVKGSKKGGKAEDKEPIFWNGDGLQVDKEQGLIDLEKNVVVTQGDFHLEADHARVFMNKATQEVNRIVATGNVRMTKIDPETKQEVKSQSNEATFYNADKKVILKGDAKLWRGADMAVKGKQISYELDTGLVKAEKVEGVVQQEAAKASK